MLARLLVSDLLLVSSLVSLLTAWLFQRDTLLTFGGRGENSAVGGGSAVVLSFLCAALLEPLGH